MSLSQRIGKSFDAVETLRRVFGKGNHYYLLNRWRNGRNLFTQEWRRSRDMPISHLRKRALKGRIATQPFIDNYTQRVLIARWTWPPLQLFRCHICSSTSHRTYYSWRAYVGSRHCNTKIAQ